MTMNDAVKTIAIVAAGTAVLSLLIFALSFSNSFQLGGRGGDRVVNPGEEVPRVADERIVLAAVGDMMLSRTVEQKMIEKEDWRYPFLETAGITRGADLLFGNLETPIVAGPVVRSGSFLFRVDPRAVEGLRYAGFDVLSLANNHTLNQGPRGLASTLQELDGAGIGHAGAGLTEALTSAPAVREVKGVKFGFLAYTYAREGLTGADGKRCGTNYMDKEKMRAEVEELRKSVDVVVVSMHAGTEYATQPHPDQTAFARAAIDAGAQLVIGHHPHVVQTFERYRGGYILYSLGNFVFDQMWSEETRLGAIAKVTFEKGSIAGIEFVPIKTFDYAQPRLAEGEEKEMILERLRFAEN